MFILVYTKMLTSFNIVFLFTSYLYFKVTYLNFISLRCDIKIYLLSSLDALRTFLKNIQVLVIEV